MHQYACVCFSLNETVEDKKKKTQVPQMKKPRLSVQKVNVIVVCLVCIHTTALYWVKSEMLIFGSKCLHHN